MDLKKRIKYPDTLFAQEVDGEMVLLDMQSENYFGLDAVASEIWTRLQEGKTLEETLGELMQIYDVDSDTLRRDMEAFILRLIEQGLIQLV